MSGESIIKNAHVWLMVLDYKGRILEWNHAAEEMSGYPGAEVMGRNEIWKHLYPEKKYRNEITGKIAEIIRRDNYLENLQTTVVNKNGKKKIILWNTRGLPDKKESVGTYIAIGVDITDRERMLAEMRRLSDVRESVIKNAHVWLMVLDSKGRILEWNHAAEEMSGYPAAEVMGRNEIWKHLYPEKKYRNEITGKIAEIIRRDNYLENLQTTVVSKNGNKKIILWNTRGLPDEKRERWHLYCNWCRNH